jgi:catechol 2,3-dioxygenase-like lactoylglutathione lyase family enzyme
LITEIATLAVLVSDTERSKKWFKDKLGFEIKEDEDHWVVVAPAGSKTGIHLCKTGELQPGNQGILFLADDVDATCKELKNRGVELTRPLGKAEWNEKTKYAMFKDPDGNEYWLMPK